MTTEVTAEFDIARGASAWPLFAGVDADLAVLSVRSTAGAGTDLDDAAAAAMAELLEVVGGSRTVVLFAAHDAYQPNSAMARRRSLWDVLGLVRPSSGREDVVEEVDGRHRKAGLAVLTPEEAVEAARSVRSIPFAAFLLAPAASEPDLTALYDGAFGTGSPRAGAIDWARFPSAALALDLLPVRCLGRFDDPDATVDLFATPDAIRTLARAAS